MEHNQLFPIFLKLNELRVLIIGGGNVALEKLSAILTNAPETSITLVAKEIKDEIKELAEKFHNIQLIQNDYSPTFLTNHNLLISAVNDIDLSEKIKNDAASHRILSNAADKPELCDFYLGSIVQKGNLKIAISTNGKSPSLAKRIKELLHESIPEETNEVLENLYEIRNNLKVDFEEKVATLNRLTQNFSPEKKENSLKVKIRKASLYSLIIIVSMFIGHLLLSYIPFSSIRELGNDMWSGLDQNFWLFVAGGFLAQMIDGALGMAYGVSVTTFLLSLGLPTISPAIASASMHASEIFTTGSSSLVYMRFKNINMKLFRILVWPGILGAILGVLTVSILSKENLVILKPFVAIYTLTLGSIIIFRTLKKPKTRKKIKTISPIAFSGGLLDSIGGGGWGPIVTSSLLAGGRHLKYAIGSAHLAKFFVALVSTVTFIITIGFSHWQIIFGLVIGGMIASPISIYISTKIPTKKGLILVGTVIILISVNTLIKSIL